MNANAYPFSKLIYHPQSSDETWQKMQSLFQYYRRSFWRSRNNFINSSAPGPKGCHFADDICKCIFKNETFYILIRISLKFVLKCPIDNKSALVQVMAWCRIGDEPLPKAILIQSNEAYMRRQGAMG